MLLSLLLECILSDRLERLLDVDSLFCGGLKVRDVAFRLAPSHGTLLSDLQVPKSSLNEAEARTTTTGNAYLTLALLHINLVPQHDEGEVLRVMWARLNQEFVPPAVKCFERLRTVHVVDQYAAVCTTVEGYAQ